MQIQQNSQPKVLFSVLMWALAFGSGACNARTNSPAPAQSSVKHDVGNEVRSGEEAIHLAKSALALRLGQQAADGFEPYLAKLKGDIWIVVGDPHLKAGQLGPAPHLEISKSTGKVLMFGVEV